MRIYDPQGNLLVASTGAVGFEGFIEAFPLMSAGYVLGCSTRSFDWYARLVLKNNDSNTVVMVPVKSKEAAQLVVEHAYDQVRCALKPSVEEQVAPHEKALPTEQASCERASGPLSGPPPLVKATSESCSVFDVSDCDAFDEYADMPCLEQYPEVVNDAKRLLKSYCTETNQCYDCMINKCSKCKL